MRDNINKAINNGEFSLEKKFVKGKKSNKARKLERLLNLKKRFDTLYERSSKGENIEKELLSVSRDYSEMMFEYVQLEEPFNDLRELEEDNPTQYSFGVNKSLWKSDTELADEN